MTDLVGRRLSHYVIESSLGRGGMGEVYKGTDARLRRPVAIKVLSPEGVSPLRRERFLRESQAASALNHPGIVTIHDVGHEDSLDFIVTEARERGPNDRDSSGRSRESGSDDAGVGECSAHFCVLHPPMSG